MCFLLLNPPLLATEATAFISDAFHTQLPLHLSPSARNPRQPPQLRGGPGQERTPPAAGRAEGGNDGGGAAGLSGAGGGAERGGPGPDMAGGGGARLGLGLCWLLAALAALGAQAKVGAVPGFGVLSAGILVVGGLERRGRGFPAGPVGLLRVGRSVRWFISKGLAEWLLNVW